MIRSSQSAGEFVARLAELAQRLAKKDIVVSSFHADWANFGCWQLQAQNGAASERYGEGLRSSNPTSAVGPEVIRAFWDGREAILSIEASPTRPMSAPNEWKVEFEKDFPRSGDEAIRFIEDYLTTRLGA